MSGSHVGFSLRAHERGSKGGFVWVHSSWLLPGWLADWQPMRKMGQRMSRLARHLFGDEEPTTGIPDARFKSTKIAIWFST
jgi:hypothetical protein